jgi:hypothetical protein
LLHQDDVGHRESLAQMLITRRGLSPGVQGQAYGSGSGPRWRSRCSAGPRSGTAGCRW